MEVRSIKKGEVIQRKGELNTKVYFVESGLLRSYCLDKNGKENIFMFAPEGWLIADSHGPDVPAVLFIEALEDSVVKVLPKDLEREKKNIPALTRRIAALQDRVLMLLSSSGLERYEHFEKAYSDLMHRIPQRMIARYLGITPERLSKIRGERPDRNSLSQRGLNEQARSSASNYLFPETASLPDIVVTKAFRWEVAPRGSFLI